MKSIYDYIGRNIHKIYIALIIVLSISFLIILKFNVEDIFHSTKSINEIMKYIYITTGIFVGMILILSMFYYYILRKNIVEFSDRISNTIDNIVTNKEDIKFEIYEESITSKIENKLKQLFEIIKNEKIENLNEKDNIKSLISDISHQIKTPIANISMYNETLIDRELNKEQQNLCLNNMKFQVDKLEWLVKCLIKMSRLENGIISLDEKEVNISEIIANALGGVYLKAEAKDINIDVDYDDSLRLRCDVKWTSEAIFNILENAVKYTDKGGYIKIVVEKLEMFTRIDIIDNGIGINENDINNIFKRFYRCSEVNNAEGVGIGLYLAREIVSKQGGYIKVKSNKGEGSRFSLYI